MADKNKAHAPRPRKGKSSGPWLQNKSNLAKLGLLGGLVVVLVVIIVVLYLPGDDKKRRRRPPPPVAQSPVQAPAPGPTSPPVPGPTSPPAPAPVPQDNQPPEEGPPGDEAAPGDMAYPGDGGETAYGPGAPGGPGGQDGPAQPDQQPKRPEDVSKWKGQDFYGARQEGDQRLIEAVGLLAKRAPGDTKVAENLAKLLEPLPKKEGSAEGSPTPYGPRFGGSDPKLIQALVAALGANGSDLSRTLLGQLLAGTLPTDDDKTAVEAALNALVTYPSPKTDEILFRALSAAESMRPQPKGEIGADQLRQMTLAAVSATASQRLRTKLARYLIQPNTPPERRDQMGGFLRAEHPDNVGAQLILYQSQQTLPETKAALEQYFTGYSSAALARALGLPQTQPGSPAEGSPQRGPNPGTAPGRDPFGESSYGQEDDGPGAGRPNVPAVRPSSGQPGGLNVNQAAARPPDPDAPFRRARQLWSPQTVAIIEGRLGELTSLEEQTRLVLLAGTIPVDSTRSALWKVLHDRWEDGPEQLEAAGLATSLISDPGMLLTIKTLPRKRSTTPTTSPGGYRRPGDSYGQGNRFRPGGRDRAGQPPSATQRAGTAQDTAQDTSQDTSQEKAQKLVETQQAWMDTSESLVRAWCERFHAAGLAQAQAARNPVAAPGQGESKARGPVRLHDDPNIVSEYHLTWPGDLGAKLSGVAAGPMEVHYIRIADTAKRNARLGFYRRQPQLGLDMDEILPIERGGWLDRVQRVPKTDQGPIDKTGWRRSVDVLITAVEEKPEPNRQGEIDLVIQILSIEMKNPARDE